MIRINDNYQKLAVSYLFAEIARRTKAFQEANPQRKIIRLGIGDVTEPLPSVCIEAFHRAVEEMGHRETFRGYKSDEGYEFLREAIAKHDFQARGADISPEEIFISDGAKCDTANVQEIFSTKIKVAIPDPVYPVYIDTNVMAGRTGINKNGRYGKVLYLDCTARNGYVPAPPKKAADLIYLCFPNNPTGAVATREQLKVWVDYAKQNKAIILYDAAYEVFIRDETIPHSIFEIEGAKEVAIECRSFSKTAGFTGVRCAYMVIPKNLTASDAKGEPQSVHALWNRRHWTKFNGVSYPVQRAAEAVFTPDGQKQVRALADFYLGNARLIREALTKLGYKCCGGDNAPYVWARVNEDSWKFFDRLLQNAGVVCTPGAGFGRCGEGHIRLSAFNSRENVQEALARLKEVLQK